MALNKGPPEEMERTKNGPITWKQLSFLSVLLLALASAISFFVTPVIASTIMDKVREETVSRKEFELILKRLDSIQADVKELRRSR